MKNNKVIKLIALFALAIFGISQVNNPAFAKVVPQQNNKLEYLNLVWWQNFNDPFLEKYLMRAYDNNHDLKIASAKIKQGQQIVKQSLGQEMPQLQFAGNLGRTLSSSDLRNGEFVIPNFSQSEFLLPLTMNYEVDIWGKNRQKTKSAQKQLNMLKQSERATYISLSSEVAIDYYNLVKIDKMLDYQNNILSTQINIFKMIEAKHNSGLAPVNDVLYEKKILTNIEDEKNILTQNREILANQMRTLLDLPQDERLNKISFDKISFINIPTQINSDVIYARPDVVISEEQLKKIGIDIKIAKKELLPSFILSGQVGFNAYSWKSIFDSNSFLSSVGVVPFWDIFTGGQKLAYLKFQKYKYDEIMEQYQKAILTSLQEVNDTLLIAKTARKNYKGSVERLNIENTNYDLISRKYNIGGISKLQRLKAQEALLISEKNEVSNKMNCLISVIGLYKAVGGQDLSKLKVENI